MTQITGKVRREWVDSSEFHPLTNVEVLRNVHTGIEGETKRGSTPVLLLDLDSTLYHVESRSHQIIREWIDAPESREHASVRERLKSLLPEHLGYSLTDTLTKFGVSVMDPAVESALKSMYKFWGRRFFTNEYLAYDRAYPGAPEFVQAAYELGAEIVYLTGRDEPGMGKGTHARLVADRFPIDRPRTRLLLKKSFELDDLEHKSAAADVVKKLGSLVASFENEPPNLIALSDIFPAAMHVFVDTVMSDRPARPRAGLYRITGFE
ncbi:MAG: HAD family hydrolase [Bdellovibrionales bacterium]|nr:HAD family hydrolase [Bdellovibrionales bacterium]